MNAVFNIQNDRYDEEKMISTQVTIRGIRFKSNEEELPLLQKIHEMSIKLRATSDEWKYLSSMEIVEGELRLGNLA